MSSLDQQNNFIEEKENLREFEKLKVATYLDVIKKTHTNLQGLYSILFLSSLDKGSIYSGSWYSSTVLF